MADIKNYLNEKEKRERKQNDYKKKIRKHKRANMYRILLLLAALAAIAVLILVQYKRHIYTDYDIVSSIKRDKAGESTDVRLQDAVLTYSKDGAHCTDVKGEVTWNQTYEIQDIKLAKCQDVVAIGNYNGREIYVQNTNGQMGTITTTMPIRNLAVSANGYVTAVLADTNVTWINTYNPQGENKYSGSARMHDSGYPAAVSLSPNGELLAVSYVYVDAGVVKTNIAFYNFGPVGANHSDYIVSAYSYEDMLVPQVTFMNDETAFAVGDSRLMIYKGAQKPVSAAEHLYEDEVQSVFYNEEYIGLVFLSDDVQGKYRIDIYGAENAKEKIGSYYFDTDYTDIFFEEGQFVVYNDTECTIMTFDNVEKYKGVFSKVVNLMLSTGTAYKYVLVTDNTIDTIQLK